MNTSRGLSYDAQTAISPFKDSAVNRRETGYSLASRTLDSKYDAKVKNINNVSGMSLTGDYE